jgi:hypothetical protein
MVPLFVEAGMQSEPGSRPQSSRNIRLYANDFFQRHFLAALFDGSAA